MSMEYDSYQPHLYDPSKPIDPPKTRWIWNVFWILLVVTTVEVGLAFANWKFNFMPEQVLKVIYILLTLAKAYYIIFSYMHLGDERKNFKLTLGFLVVLLVYFIALMMIEGYYQEDVRLIFPEFMRGIREGAGHH